MRQIGETVTVDVTSDEKAPVDKDEGGSDGDGEQSGKEQATKSSSEGKGGGKAKKSGNEKDDEDVSADTKGIEGEWLQSLTTTVMFIFTFHYSAVTSRPSPTIVAFQVLKLTIDKNGVITTHVKSGFEHPHRVSVTQLDHFPP